MSVSVADIVLERVKGRLDEAAPTVGASAVFDTLALLLQSRLVRSVPGQGGEYLKRLIVALDTPLPRILVTGWRTYEECLRFAASLDGTPGRSGEVDLFDYEMKSRWEIAPRLEGKRLAGPRLLVGLTLGIDIGTVVIRDGRFTALEAVALRYDAFIQVKEAPKELATITPRQIEIPGGRLDFGDGWPIRPSTG
jgi:hypothetical protein